MKKWAFDGPLMSFAFDRGGVVGSEKNIFWICALTPQISLSRSEPHVGYEAPSTLGLLFCLLFVWHAGITFAGL